MHYLERRLAQNVEYVRTHGELPKYDDTACGQELLDAWNSGSFGRSDIALQFSIDGAQLRPDQPSEAWVFIWVIHNLPPSMRYKKDFVVPGAIVPGPNKPGDLESFLFPSLYHVAALQREGLRICDSSTNTIIPRSIPCVLFGTADSLGSAAMLGMVGHIGKYGCRLYCDMLGRRWDGDSHYYPAMALPRDYSTMSWAASTQISLSTTFASTASISHGNTRRTWTFSWLQRLRLIIRLADLLWEYANRHYSMECHISQSLCRASLLSISCICQYLTIQISSSSFLPVKWTCASPMTGRTGTGLSFIGRLHCGEHMGSVLPWLSRFCPRLLVVRLGIQPRSLILDTRLGSFNNIYTVWVLLSFAIYCRRNTGSIFVNLYLVSAFSSAIPSHTRTYLREMNYCLALSRSSRISTISGWSRAFILCDRVSIFFRILPWRLFDWDPCLVTLNGRSRL